jgi:hypothetical protein
VLDFGHAMSGYKGMTSVFLKSWKVRTMQKRTSRRKIRGSQISTAETKETKFGGIHTFQRCMKDKT